MKSRCQEGEENQRTKWKVMSEVQNFKEFEIFHLFDNVAKK
jgi:hypothetical protein